MLSYEKPLNILEHEEHMSITLLLHRYFIMLENFFNSRGFCLNKVLLGVQVSSGRFDKRNWN